MGQRNIILEWASSENVPPLSSPRSSVGGFVHAVSGAKTSALGHATSWTGCSLHSLLNEQISYRKSQTLLALGLKVPQALNGNWLISNVAFDSWKKNMKR